jgi:hypothetical protein
MRSFLRLEKKMSKRKITIQDQPFEWQFITQHGLSAGIKFWQNGKSRIVSMEELGYKTGDEKFITPSDVTKWAERVIFGKETPLEEAKRTVGDPDQYYK